jgi:NADH:ubiquinone reductase (H+-translocating)
MPSPTLPGTAMDAAGARVGDAEARPRRRPRVVIAGGGFAGLAAARELRFSDVDVLVIDRRNHHIFQPLLYQFATAVLAPSDVAAPLRQLAQRQRNVSVVLGEVTAIDRAERCIEVVSDGAERRRIRYDFLVLALGVSPSYFGHDEFRAHAPCLKNLADAELVRSRILGAYERAELSGDIIERGRAMTFVLVGAGPTGVELAASIAQMAHVTLRSNFRRIDPADTRVVLLEGAPRILGSFSEALAADAQARLRSLGVEVRTGATVTAVDEDGVTVGGERIATRTVLWTAGVQAPAITRALGTEIDKAGRLRVGADLTLAGDSAIYAVGDIASVLDRGRAVPGIAQGAIQQGQYAGRSIEARIKSMAPPAPFRYADRGTMAVVGKNFALLQKGDFGTSGFFTWWLWALIHLVYLPQLQNRLRVQAQWLVSYFSGQRGSRLIAEPLPAQPPVLQTGTASPRPLAASRSTA